MRSKNIISTIILAFFAFIGGGSFSDGELITVGISFAVGVVVIVVINIVQSSKDKEAEEQKNKENEELERKNTNKYNEDVFELEEKYGEPDLIIDIYDIDKFEKEEVPISVKTAIATGDDNTKRLQLAWKQNLLNRYINRTKSVDNAILVYENRNVIRIMGEVRSFKDIIGYSIDDNSKVIHGNTTALTKTSTGSMIGRSVVGDLVAGPAGAIIGGSTAKKNTTFVQGDDLTVHNYTININVNSIANPIIHINIGNNSELVNKIAGLINVILNRNEQ